MIAQRFRGCYETQLVVASVEQSRKSERRKTRMAALRDSETAKRRPLYAR